MRLFTFFARRRYFSSEKNVGQSKTRSLFPDASIHVSFGGNALISVEHKVRESPEGLPLAGKPDKKLMKIVAWVFVLFAILILHLFANIYLENFSRKSL
jgi:hypothetical protein